MPATLGLLAGGGELASVVLAALREHGHDVAVVGVKETDEALLNSVPRSIRVEVTEVERAIRFLKDAGVRDVLMAGYVSHTQFIKPHARTTVLSRILGRLKDRRADTLLLAAALQLKLAGMRLVSAMPYLKHLIPARGTLSRRPATEDEARSIQFGFKMARAIAGLDIGQTVVVKGQAVVAVESLEGTDACIRRGGEIGQGGTVVVKVAKPRQDFRFDVPVVGIGTIESLKASGATAFAMEAGKTIFLNRDRVIAAADDAGIALLAI